MSTPINRRQFVQGASAGAAAAASAFLLPAAAASAAAAAPSQPRTRRPRPSARALASHDLAGNPVSLYCSVSATSDYDASGSGSVAILCGNDSLKATTGSISLKFLTPFLTSTSTADITAPSGWAIKELFADNDSFTPSIYQIQTTNALGPGATAEFTIKLQTAANTPNRPPAGKAIFSTDASNASDFDTDLIQNYWSVGLDRTKLATVTPGNVNLVWGGDVTPQVPGGPALRKVFRFYNFAGRFLHGTTSTSYFYFYTPAYTNVAAQGRPDALTAVYENSDPAIPSIYKLAVPPGVGQFGYDQPTEICIPFEVVQNAHGDAPLGALRAGGIYAPGGTDVQGDLSDTHHALSTLSALNAAV